MDLSEVGHGYHSERKEWVPSFHFFQVLLVITFLRIA